MRSTEATHEAITNGNHNGVARSTPTFCLSMKMRFSIRTALTGTLFAALSIAVVVLSISRARLTAEIVSLRNMNGVLTDERDEDRIDMMSIGPGLPSKASGQIFRVENHHDYELVVDFICTTWPQSKAKQMLKLNLPQYAITYDEDHRQIFVQSTLGSVNGDHYRIDVPAPGAPLFATPVDTRRPVSKSPFLTVIYGDPGSDRARPKTKADLIDYCKNNQYNGVTFSLNKR